MKATTENSVTADNGTDVVPLDYTVMHGAYIRAQNALIVCHEAFRQTRRVRNLCVLGPSGSGKSRLFEDYYSAHLPYDIDDRTIVPVVHAVVPTPPSVGALHSALLASIGDGKPWQGSPASKLERFRKLCDECATEIILLDEVHHFMDRGQRKTREGGADAIKMLQNCVKRPIAMTGAPRLREFLNVNGQFRSRFRSERRLPAFGITSVKQAAEWQKVLCSLATRLRKVTNPEFIYVANPTRFFYASDGLLRPLINLMDAIEDMPKPTALDFTLMAKLYREAISLDAVGAANPFDRGFKFERLTAPGQPYAPTELDGDNHQWDGDPLDDEEDVTEGRP